MALGDRGDPFVTHNFVVTIQNSDVAAFSEVAGLDADRDPIDYRVGTDPNRPRKLIGLSKYTEIQLKRGYTTSDFLWRWYADIFAGDIERRQVAITLQDEGHNPVLRWNIEAAWIKKIQGPALNASGNEVAIEMCELCHEGITLEVQG